MGDGPMGDGRFITHAEMCYPKWENEPVFYGTKIRNGIMLFFVKTDPL